MGICLDCWIIHGQHQHVAISHLTCVAVVTGNQMDIKYVVDFDSALVEIITETKYMEQLSFSVPELARNVALQEEKYIKYVDGLKHMLERYHSVLTSLDNAEASLLEDHMRELRRVIRPGAKRLNWNSLGINDFIAKCDSVSIFFFCY